MRWAHGGRQYSIYRRARTETSRWVTSCRAEGCPESLSGARTQGRRSFATRADKWQWAGNRKGQHERRNWEPIGSTEPIETDLVGDRSRWEGLPACLSGEVKGEEEAEGMPSSSDLSS